jgi:hypothetical protein
MTIRGKSTVTLNSSQHCESIRESRREQKSRHDGIGIAEICVVVLDPVWNRRQPTAKIDDKHDCNCIATELIERTKSSRHGRCSRYGAARRFAGWF